jgi:hypothetical protein
MGAVSFFLRHGGQQAKDQGGNNKNGFKSVHNFKVVGC